jgi:hypothetical protein
MIKLTDEILNKYIDGELDSDTLNEVREALNSSDELRKRLRALQMVHAGLNNIKPDEVTPNFTRLVMSKIQKELKVKKEERFFIFSISSVFVALSLIIIGYVIYLLAFSSKASKPLQVITNFSNTFEKGILFFKTFLGSINTSILGSIFSLIIIISAYFLFENIKRTKEQISKLN